MSDIVPLELYLVNWRLNPIPTCLLVDLQQKKLVQMEIPTYPLSTSKRNTRDLFRYDDWIVKYKVGERNVVPVLEPSYEGCRIESSGGQRKEKCKAKRKILQHVEWKLEKLDSSWTHVGRCYRFVISFSKSKCDVTDVVSRLAPIDYLHKSANFDWILLQSIEGNTVYYLHSLSLHSL